MKRVTIAEHNRLQLSQRIKFEIHQNIYTIHKYTMVKFILKVRLFIWHIRLYLTQGLSVWAHVCQDNQYVLLTLIGKVLGSRQRYTWGDNSFNAENKHNINCRCKVYKKCFTTTLMGNKQLHLQIYEQIHSSFLSITCTKC